MGLFSSSTEKSSAAQYPVNPDITRQSGSGAEQDRYGAHFGGPSADYVADKAKGAAQDVKQAANKALRYKGDGAEQDRYNTHFSPAVHSIDAKRVQQYALSLMNKAKGSANTSSSFGLGYDGQQRAQLLAGGNGSGAEQDQYGGHFALNRDAIKNLANRVQDGAQSAANSVQDGAQRVKDGARRM